MKPYVEFEYRPSFGITIAGCEGDPLNPQTVAHYAALGNQSARTALRQADAHDELNTARFVLRLTRSPIAWGRLLRAQVDLRLARS